MDAGVILMPEPKPSPLKLILLALLIAAALVIGVFLYRQRSQQTAVPAAAAPTTAQVAAPTAPPVVVADYMTLVRRADPTVATTQPLVIPVKLNDAAHVVLDNPVYVDPAGNLWITDPAAPPTEAVLREAAQQQAHVIEHAVEFVHWSADEDGQWYPALVVPRTSPTTSPASRPVEGYLYTDLSGQRPMATRRRYDWRRALSWNGQIVVPTDTGVAMFDPGQDLVESHHELIEPSPDAAPVQMLLDWRGLLAWVPPSQDHPGSDGAARFVDGQWHRLGTEQGWPARIVQLLPLLDGSVLQLIDAGDGNLQIALAPLDAPAVDRAKIEELVTKLSDPVADMRVSAFNTLMQYGPGAWPILEELADDQPPEARVRIAQLLQNRINPSLFGMYLSDGRARILRRFNDGGALLYAENGVYFDRPGEERQYVAPAWIALRPGPRVELLSDYLVRDLHPDRSELIAVQNEWVLLDEARGPMRFLGNHLAPLLKPSERSFNHLYAIDARGRWIFRDDADGTGGRTLILDPTVPDPAPRLPVWTIELSDGSVGWTAEGWPVTKRGGAWILGEEGWRPLEEANERMITQPPDQQPATLPLATQPATRPSQPPILVDTEGNRYYDGKSELLVSKPDGTQVRWTLPPEAIGDGPVHLFRNSDGRLFLFNQPGRVLRIKPTPNQKEPYVVERAFTHGIPNTRSPTQIWLDPADRIVIAEDKELTILFTKGTVPRPIQLLMPPEEEWEERRE